jgi:hypothetical protein
MVLPFWLNCIRCWILFGDDGDDRWCGVVVARWPTIVPLMPPDRLLVPIFLPFLYIEYYPILQWLHHCYSITVFLTVFYYIVMMLTVWHSDLMTLERCPWNMGTWVRWGDGVLYCGARWWSWYHLLIVHSCCILIPLLLLRINILLRCRYSAFLWLTLLVDCLMWSV